MICDLTIPGSPDEIVNLAGGGSPSSEVSGLSIGTRGNAQKVDLIGSDESRQFMRGGSLTDVSFTSSREFESRAVAQDWLFALQATLATAGNAQCEALLATRSNAATITGTLSPDATAVSPVAETFLNSNIYDSGASYPRVTITTDGVDAVMSYYADSSEFDAMTPSGVWESSTPGSDTSDPLAFTSWSATTGTGTPSFAKSTTDANSLMLYDVSANVNGSAIGRTVMLNVSLIGRNDDPSS